MLTVFIQRLRSLDPVIVWLTLGLLVFGVLMLWSATGPVAVAKTGQGLFFVQRQIVNGILPGLLLFFACALSNYRLWRPLALPALGVTVVLLVLVFVPGLGLELGGARGWIKVAGYSLQPTEFIKLTFLLYLSAWLSGRDGQHERHTLEDGLVPFLLSLGAVVFLIVMQPDTGSMAVIVLMSLFVYFLSGAPITWFVSLSVLGAGLLYFLVKYSAYRAARFMSFLHPELDPLGVGYHINQALLAIGSGGWFGLGYGHSRQKFLYLPEVQADSISAVIAEELGLVVMLLLLLVYAVLVLRCLRIARQAHDPFGRYLAGGVAAWLAVQLFLNVGSMLGVVPMTGVTMPFVSHGGSAMVSLLAAMGLVAGIPREGVRKRI